MKIKLYRDGEGRPKGDGLATYFKIESVQLALQILDGYEVRPGRRLHVERAKFELKGAYDPSKKPKQKKKKDKEKARKMEEHLFAWKPDKLRAGEAAGEVAALGRPKHERVVVVAGAFEPKDFDADASLILEFQDDFREEAAKCGNCKKVVIFDVSHTVSVQ
jgi:HIV Tat-specific factor 1